MVKLDVELDYWVVPMGLGFMLAYHLWLLRTIVKQPTRTVIGIHAINRRYWVHTMMEDSKNAVLAVQTLRNNIMASTLLASTAIMLSSVIAVLMTPSSSSSNNTGINQHQEAGGNEYTATSNKTQLIEESHMLFSVNYILGDKSELGYSIKFFSILVCFLLSFLMNVQSVRYYSHASFLVNVPFRKLASPYLSGDYVAGIVNKAGYFWSFGLRACYLSFPLFLWLFGPVPMVVSCVLLVFMLYFLDTTSDFADIR